MRNRDYKNSVAGGYYHIYNRGNMKQNIFLDSNDYAFFLLRLRQNIRPNGTEPRYFRPLPPNSFSLISYCLMPNHFHFLIRQNGPIPTGTLIGKVCTSYSMYFNKKYERVGHLFQDQFKQIGVDNDRYLLWLASYIHINPVKGSLVRTSEEYPWSSIAEYAGENIPGLCEKDIILERFGSRPGQAYLQYLQEGFVPESNTIPGELAIDL